MPRNPDVAFLYHCTGVRRLVCRCGSLYQSGRTPGPPVAGRQAATHTVAIKLRESAPDTVRLGYYRRCMRIGGLVFIDPMVVDRWKHRTSW